MVTVSWCARRIGHHFFLEKGQTIDADRYCTEMQTMHAKLKQKFPSLVSRNRVILLQDNARPHVATKTIQLIRELGYELLPHPLYSPDLSLTDYHLFRDLDNFVRGKIFKKEDEVKNAVETFFSEKSTNYFEKGIERLVERWKKCAERDGGFD